jgi:hypothetical protein
VWSSDSDSEDGRATVSEMWEGREAPAVPPAEWTPAPCHTKVCAPITAFSFSRGAIYFVLDQNDINVRQNVLLLRIVEYINA